MLTWRARAQGMYALFVTSREMYLCRDDYTSWLSRSAPGRSTLYLTPPLRPSGALHAPWSCLSPSMKIMKCTRVCLCPFFVLDRGFQKVLSRGWRA
jgi:hypothetical protein